MKKLVLLTLFLLVVRGYGFLIAGTYSGGAGTLGDPYKIATLSDLVELSNTTADWAGSIYFIQTADITIDANEQNIDWDGDGDATWDANDQLGFSPIGNSSTSFQGNYNGQGYIIDNLFINRGGSQYVGLFGNTCCGTLENIGITNCSITGDKYVGALIGWGSSTVKKCFSTGTISAFSRNIGGLIGIYSGNINIDNSYSNATVNATFWVAGFIGSSSHNSVINCYSTGIVNVGIGPHTGFISEVTGAQIENSFWDTETSGKSLSAGGTGKTTAEMKTKSTFTDATWDFDKIWNINSAINNGYPYLRVFNRIYVDASRPDDAGDGRSWATAKKTLQAALTAATTGYEIWVAAGTYKPTTEVGGSGDRFRTFQMKNGVEIFGGFAGNEAADFDINNRDFETNETILSGDIGTEDDNSDNCYHVIYNNSALSINNTAILDGFTIKGGNANHPSDHNMRGGGGIYNELASPTLQNLKVSDCFGSTGGGIYNFIQSSPYMINLKIYSNSATWGAGIMNNGGSDATIINCLIFSNIADNLGGGIHNDNSTPIISNATITNNSADYGGGFSNLNNGIIIIRNSIIYGNSASPLGNEFYLSNATCNMDYSNYSDVQNSYYSDNSTLNITNSITTDPQFVDADNNDFRLKFISPCLDIGNDAFNSETYDIRGVGFSRKLLRTDHTQVGTIDMGAYEFKEGTDGTAPTVTTSTITNIGNNNASGGGSVVLGTDVTSVIQHGLCWSTSVLPTISDSKTEEGEEAQTSFTFTSDLSGLTANQVYYVRAYITNSIGTFYGNQVAFATIPTLGEWGLIALGSLLALGGGYFVWRRIA